ncbi:response regulator [Nostoc sp. FACHB-87]|uniref:response regulator transcription factor n=1 Tax=Nostocales TaxID=1161 RepID=UPI0016834BCA|nr:MULTISPECIES: response regulator [Nostocales]MBD2299272.1 response regulator [Nostoc sp. FACHB-190]MBD2456086.1 response regulator [Nostoc sp. FACHB-87]MBD2476491.1 response regulator [Anabaena sp. FACHB-83]MBD2486577.1 response regulator [Aulosira sp. FACHB-615]
MTKKILVIEDEVQICSNIQQILGLSDFQTISANNGIDGLSLAKSDKPDLICCDIMMPDLDGYGVLKALREDPETDSIPVILLTAKVERSDLRYGMELGADDYITKPFSPEELLKAIEMRLARVVKPTLMKQKYEKERQQNIKLKQEIQVSQQKLEETKQLADMRNDVLEKLLQDLSNPLSNINMAVHMLKQVQSDNDRDRYLKILQEEYDREIMLLNEMKNLQALLTPENAKILQKFNLLHHSK